MVEEVSMFTVGPNIVVFNEVGQMVVRTHDPVVARNLQGIPYAQIMHGEAGQLLAMLPWGEDACKLFNNAGVDCTGAAPFWHTSLPLIEGKYPPMTHQLFTAAFLTLNPRAYVLSDPRTGKTGALILGMDYMQKQRIITGAVLIITTVTTIHGVWYDSIKTTLPGALVQVCHGKHRNLALATPAEFYITNYDSCRISEKAFVDAVKSGRIGAVVIDELTHVGNASSQRHKSIDKFTNKLGLAHVIGMTGSPGNNPETVFGMARMVNRWKLPCTTKAAWMDLVTYQYGSEPFMRKVSPRAPQVIHQTLQPAVRFNKADIIDLPPIVTQNRECSLSKEQEDARDQLKKQAVALLNSGEVITAANGGVLYQKLMQVAQGFINGNDGKPNYLDYKDRLKTIKEAISETHRKVVVFCVYKATITRLAKDLQAAGYSVGVVDGSITGQERYRILTDYQQSESPHVLVCHPTTTAYGVELSVADTIIFNGPPPLGGFIYAQALERLSSVKQTAPRISIIRVMASPEEKKFFSVLDSGKEMGNYIAELFESFSRGVL